MGTNRTTYRAMHMNVDAELLGELDTYRTEGMSRVKHVHAALRLYLTHLKGKNGRSMDWTGRR